MKWDASVYDRRHGFVAEYGRALLELVPDDPALSVLDLGCGTGALTARLAANGRRVDIACAGVLARYALWDGD